MNIKNFKLVLVLIALSTSSYFVHELLLAKVLPFNFAKIMNITYVVFIFSLCLIAWIRKGKVIKFLPVNIYAILILFISSIGILSNSLIEVLPSFFRFFMYYLIAYLTYDYITNQGLEDFNKKMKTLTSALLFIALAFGYFEVFFLDIKLMNGAFRLSGSFLAHPLANSMFLVITIILWLEYFVMPNKTFINVLGLLLLFYLFFNTHSRMPLVFLFASFFMYYILAEKRVIKFLKSIVLILVVLLGLLLVVVKTDVSPRLKTLVLSEKAFKDPSSNTRLVIIQNSVEGMSILEKGIGIGLGGFNKFYEKITNEKEVAAHNNFLLFFVEGGFIGLILFIAYQLILFFTLIRFIRKPRRLYQKINYYRMIFVSVFLLEICSFLLNNYYFFTSQAIVFILIGLLMYLEINEDKLHEIEKRNVSEI